MKRAWLILYAGDWTIVFEEPQYYSGQLIPIVYQVLEEGPPA